MPVKTTTSRRASAEVDPDEESLPTSQPAMLWISCSMVGWSMLISMKKRPRTSLMLMLAACFSMNTSGIPATGLASGSLRARKIERAFFSSAMSWIRSDTPALPHS